MIKNYADFKSYVAADKAHRFPNGCGWLALALDDVWRFQVGLRRLELAVNARWPKPIVLIMRIRQRKRGARLGFTIPPNVFGPGLSIAHPGTIVVNGGARVGKNCRLHVCTNIGTQAGFKDRAPTIGDDCYMGPGAKLFGSIVIGNCARIGANAVVTRSFPEHGLTLLGVPARATEARDVRTGEGDFSE